MADKDDLGARDRIAADGYFDELRRNWRSLLAATLGISAGVGIAIYPQSILAPYLLKDFGWSKSEFAMLGMMTLLALVIFPAAGRLVDLFGPRRIMLPGIILYPLSWVAFSYMNGTIAMYLALAVLQLCAGALVTSIVYSKIVAQIFEKSRGLALSIMMSGPAAAGALMSPLLTRYVETAGWRAGYIAVGAIIALLGLAAYLILPKETVPAASRLIGTGRNWKDYRRAFASPAFWILFGGLALCNIPNVLHTSQMSIMLLDRGLGAETAATAISTFALGVIAGRFACGLALDRFPPENVAAITMALPALGFFLLALNVSVTPIVIGTMLLVGLSQGAEGDIGAYLTIKYFDVEVYGTVYGMVVSNAVVSTAVGAGILSATLARTDNYSAFLYLGSFSILLGSLVLLLLKACSSARDRPVSPAIPHRVEALE